MLRVPAAPASLSVIRHTIGGIATALGLGPAAVSDVRLALTEVVTTALRRSSGDDACIEVRAEHADSALRITICDEGRALPISGELPLPLVAAISDAVELTHLPNGGTSVTMTFRSAPDPSPA
jgi:anti-sigma regulatory factor (Ser/Thr protein kinase)